MLEAHRNNLLLIVSWFTHNQVETRVCGAFELQQEVETDGGSRSGLMTPGHRMLPLCDGSTYPVQPCTVLSSGAVVAI